SFGHGANDSQKGMGIITAALVTGGLLQSKGGKLPVPSWVVICCPLAMGGGTMAGGWRIIKTMGQRITKLTPFGGFSAETAGGITIVANAIFGVPVSTTHTIIGAIVGVGASRRLTAVRWGLTRRIVSAWILIIPGAAVFGAMPSMAEPFYFAIAAALGRRISPNMRMFPSSLAIWSCWLNLLVAWLFFSALCNASAPSASSSS